MNNVNFNSHPSSYRSNGVSIEAQYVLENIASCHKHIVDNSIFMKEYHRLQLQKQFQYYKSIWEDDTMFASSVSDIVNNTGHRSIVEMGYEVIPFILKDLERNDNIWFYALQSLTGHNPIKPEHRGVYTLMKQDWLEWAKTSFNDGEIKSTSIPK